MTDQDPLVIFTPSGKRGRVPVGTPVLQAARQLGVDLDSVCGGRGICSKCQITPAFGDFSKHGVNSQETALSEWNAVEERYDSIRGLPKGRRLGCQATIQNDVVIDVPAESQVHKQVVRKRAEVRDIVLDPATKLYFVEVEEPTMDAPSGDLERLKTALSQQWGLENVNAAPSIFDSLQKTLRDGDWKVTVAINSQAQSTILQVWPGFYEDSIYGLAIDLGSTTIAAHLCDLQTGTVVTSSGIMNPQIRFGEDLMSRVSYVMMNPGGEVEMTSVVRDAINTLVTNIAADAEISTDQIFETVLVANPIMHHLFLGIDPTEIGQAPFALTVSDALNLSAIDCDIQTHPAARLYLLPCIAGHVGADAASVALSETPYNADELTLIVDVGTNAEIQLGNKSRHLACSSPTGPAFEGAEISSGQRAAPGAIESVRIDPVTKEPKFKIIGSDLWSDQDGFKEASLSSGITGICGSGIIESIAEMRLAGIVDAGGLIGSAEQIGSSRVVEDGRTNAYILFDGREDGGPLISVTNADIRAIQLAKAALYAGARLLMDEMGVDQVERVTLAGAFGAHISPKHAMILGMIPDCPLENVSSAGNAAGTGARIALLNVAARREIEQAVKHITKIETAIEPRFQEHFVAASNIPHASDPFPNLLTHVSLPNVSFNVKQTGRRRRR